MRGQILLLAATAMTFAPSIHAEAVEEARIAAFERQLSTQQRRIEQLEALVARQVEMLQQLGIASPPPSISVPPPPDTMTGSASQHVVGATEALETAEGKGLRVPDLDIGGDIRMRQEWNDDPGRNRSRSAVRARLRATHAIANDFAIGAQMTTGDADDPNSADVNLGDFLDSFDVSLDQVWVRYQDRDFTAYAGKFPQILERTDMLWDGDVSPQGAAIAYETGFGGLEFDARAIYSIIDEVSAVRDSDMLGGQVSLSTSRRKGLRIGLTGSYYHYRLDSVVGADSGDFRGNLLAGERYSSDFHLAEGIATLSWRGLSPNWPVSFTADYVRNLGAAVPADTAFNLELAAGRALRPRDWRVVYNFSQVEVDSVLAAFSQDNIALSTNYELHGLGISYVPASRFQLDLLWYHYRLLDRTYAGSFSTGWRDRLRLALLAHF